jgi:hypothetical protein
LIQSEREGVSTFDGGIIFVDKVALNQLDC